MIPTKLPEFTFILHNNGKIFFARLQKLTFFTLLITFSRFALSDIFFPFRARTTETFTKFQDTWAFFVEKKADFP